MIISSTQNPKIKHLLALQQKSSLRRKEGLFVVEGQRELSHCLGAGYEAESIFMLEHADLGELQIAGGCETFEVTPNVYSRIAYRESTEGVIAIIKAKQRRLEDLNGCQRPLPPSSLRGGVDNGNARQGDHEARADVAPAGRHSDSGSIKRVGEANGNLFVVIEGVEKPGNIGAILRSADAAGVDAVIVCDPLTDLYNPNLIRSSIGAIFTVPTIACTSEECIAFLKEHHIQILTAQLQDSSPYYATDMQRPTAIVMGTEATGLTQIWREAADAHIRIPMLGRLDSLNVSVSAAILMFEAVRQREQ